MTISLLVRMILVPIFHEPIQIYPTVSRGLQKRLVVTLASPDLSSVVNVPTNVACFSKCISSLMAYLPLYFMNTLIKIQDAVSRGLAGGGVDVIQYGCVKLFIMFQLKFVSHTTISL